MHRKLTTAHINLSKKFPLCTRKSSTSRRKKENKRKVRKTKDKRLKQRARHLLGNLTSIEVAGQIFGSIEENDRVTPVDSINTLDPLLWLLEKGIFSTTLAKNLEQVAAILRAIESDDEAQEANEVVELDDEAQDEADEAVESDLV